MKRAAEAENKEVLWVGGDDGVRCSKAFVPYREMERSFSDAVDYVKGKKTAKLNKAEKKFLDAVQAGQVMPLKLENEIKKGNLLTERKVRSLLSESKDDDIWVLRSNKQET